MKLVWMAVAALVVSFQVGAHEIDSTEAYLNMVLAPENEFVVFEEVDVAGIRTLISRNVSTRIRRYSASVADCAQGLTHLRLIVSRAGLHVDGGGATFSDGSTKDVSFSQSFREGYTSPWISSSYFGTGGKCVRSVYVNARSTHATESSHVVVQGKFE
ncbi:MAG TPA: hypothetical protein PKC28_06115 [Bdellovibrionales bacterium]|nr:hypothetical protein [Bdellovibrionales bacterium]